MSIKKITLEEFEEKFEYQNGSNLSNNKDYKLILDSLNRAFWVPNYFFNVPGSDIDFSFFEDFKFERTLDIGSGFGFSSVALGQVSSIVECWEPSVNAFKVLDSNLDIAVNTYTKNTVYNRYNVAITNTNLWSTEIAEVHNNFTDSHIKLNEDIYNDQLIEYTLVKQQTVDSYNFNDVGIINVDANGYEYFVLYGAKETIKQCNPFICINLKEKLLQNYRNTDQEVYEFLTELNYIEVHPNIFSSKQ
jgi:FkbM family methyltransferase